MRIRNSYALNEKKITYSAHIIHFRSCAYLRIFDIRYVQPVHEICLGSVQGYQKMSEWRSQDVPDVLRQLVSWPLQLIRFTKMSGNFRGHSG